ncbi:hypothetical protein DL95DRAFT_418491 [Leptodontidium sp. 2 PMI_412]|nr:hypothetical protein DL95DRAFT_418491 [Leptodontidium sp. 2 PMI_412]
MQLMIFSLSLMLAIKTAFALGHPPLVCLTNPRLSLRPGDVVSAELSCMGTQSAEFTVPPDVPNGIAYVLWQCADQSTPSCTQAFISNGLENADTISPAQSGRITCPVPMPSQNTLSAYPSSGIATSVPISTQQIVTTSTGSSATITSTFSSTVFGRSTEAPQMWSSSAFSTETLSSVSTGPSTTVTDVKTNTLFSAQSEPTATDSAISTLTISSISTDSSTTVTDVKTSTIFSAQAESLATGSAVSTQTLSSVSKGLSQPAATVSPVSTQTFSTISTGVSTTVTNILASTLFPISTQSTVITTTGSSTTATSTLLSTILSGLPYTSEHSAPCTTMSM